MRIEISAPASVAPGEEVVMRVTLINDSYEAVEIWRNRLLGPTADSGAGVPAATSVEATYGQPEEPLVLQPFTFYGRERRAGGFPAGSVAIHASYELGEGEALSVSREVTVA